MGFIIKGQIARDITMLSSQSYDNWHFDLYWAWYLNFPSLFHIYLYSDFPKLIGEVTFGLDVFNPIEFHL